MKRLINCAAVLVLCSAPVAMSEARAQTGSPTALPPGGPNQAGISGPAGTTQPTGRAGTTQPTGRAGTTQPTGRPGVTQPAGRVGTTFGGPATAVTRRDAAAAQIGQGFDAGFGRASQGDRFSTPGRTGNNPGVFVPDPSSGSIRNPVSALPGRPNFSGGTNSATFQPAAPIAGGANPGNQIFRRDGFSFDATPADITPFNGRAAIGFGSALNVPRVVVPPAVIAPQSAAAPAGSNSPVSPQVYVAPIPVPVGEAATAESETEVTTFSATPIPAQLQQDRVATATAFPDRTRAEDQEIVETASTRSLPPAARSHFVEIDTATSERRTASYRGDGNTTAQRDGLAHVYPGYTLWQGYYWHHSPSAGWQYWDGDRWIRF